MKDMKTEHTYTQCLLRRHTSAGFAERVAWIPTEFAARGASVSVRIDHEWQDGWTVVKTYSEVTKEHLKGKSPFRDSCVKTDDLDI